MDSGRSKCCYGVGVSYDYGNTRFPAGAFSMKFFQIFNGEIMCIGGAQDLKTVKSLCESDNSCFLCGLIVWNLEKNEKTMKTRCPFNVTHKGKSVIFIQFWRLPLENQVFQESLWSLYIKHFGGFQGRSHAAAPVIDGIRGCLARGPWGRPKLRSAILVNWKNVVLRTDRSLRDLARL